MKPRHTVFAERALSECRRLVAAIEDADCPPGDKRHDILLREKLRSLAHAIHNLVNTHSKQHQQRERWRQRPGVAEKGQTS